MTIKNTESLSMAEATEYITKENVENTEVIGFIRKFSKLDFKKAKELRGKIVALDLMKINEKHIAKLIDILPETAEEINKIFNDVGLDEDETKKILDTIKEFK